MFLKNNVMIPSTRGHQSYEWHLVLFYAKIKSVKLIETRGELS